jgi:hypothetical protein
MIWLPKLPRAWDAAGSGTHGFGAGHLKVVWGDDSG